MSIPYKYKVYNILKNYRGILQRVKEIIHRIDPSAEIYVFGSVVEGKYTGASDIDVLVITDKIEEKYDIMVNVYKEVDAPIELHIVSREQFKRWYSRFIRENEMIRI